MCLSTKTKLCLLNTLPRIITSSTANDYIIYLKEPIINRAILQRFLKSLSHLDIKINVQMQMVKEDINNIQSRTPLEDEESNKLREAIQEYTEIYNMVAENLCYVKPAMFIKIFDKEIIKSHNTHTQYLLFQMAVKYPKLVITYILSNIQNNSAYKKIYISYLGSLLARLKTDRKIVKKSLEHFSNFLKIKIYDSNIKGDNNNDKHNNSDGDSDRDGRDDKHNNNDGDNNIHNNNKQDNNNHIHNNISKEIILMSQTFLYILCFHRELLLENEKLIYNIFNSNIIKYMNKNIVNTFIRTCGNNHGINLNHNINLKEYNSDNYIVDESLCYFPFDPTLIKDIGEKYKKSYRIF
ncbi:hypothetical protein SLOPH_850, partial [Spraguea lophii 42_110]